jgi:hypothetical protein
MDAERPIAMDQPDPTSGGSFERDQKIPGAGIDLENRPGDPMETEPRPAGNAHWSAPDKQRATVSVLKRAELDVLTPVFSNAMPPRGLSGMVRRLAYRIPEHRASHWAILLLGDRIDVLEHRAWRGLPLVASFLAYRAWGAIRSRRSRRSGWARALRFR